MQTPGGYHDTQPANRRATPPPQGGPNDGRVLQAPDAPLFGSHTPLTAGTLRGAVFATIGLLITGAMLLLESQTGMLPDWWPAVLTPLLIQILRIWEAYVDQLASGA